MGEEPCNTGLALGLCGGADVFASPDRKRHRDPVQLHLLLPPCAKLQEEPVRQAGEGQVTTTLRPAAAAAVLEDAPAHTKAHGAGAGGSNADGSDGARKKLRLTKEQSTLLEVSFREHGTLSPTQKQELAARLKLQPRQLEVWFQNRRARTKMKRTEEDCKFLKERCESLRDENRRLKKELQELRSMRNGWPFCAHLPRVVAASAMCPSCERITASGRKGTSGGTGVSGGDASAGKGGPGSATTFSRPLPWIAI